MGKFTSDTRTASIYIGFFKGIQSAGGAISYRINNSNLSSMNELLICWILLAVSLVIAAPVIIYKIRDDADGEDTAGEETATDMGCAEISEEKASVKESSRRGAQRKQSEKEMEIS